MCKWEPLDCGVSNFRQPHVTVKTYVFPNMNGWMSIHKLQLFLDVNKRVSVVRSIAVMVWHASGISVHFFRFRKSGLWLFWGTSRRRGQAAGSFRPLFLSLSVQLSLGVWRLRMIKWQHGGCILRCTTIAAVQESGYACFDIWLARIQRLNDHVPAWKKIKIVKQSKKSFMAL